MILSQSSTNIKTIVRYDRSQKRYLAINGATTYHATKTDALLKALANDHPQLSDVVTRLASRHGHSNEIVARLIKAAQLICSGNVYQTGEVASQSRADVYHRVTWAGTPKSYKCSCEDSRSPFSHIVNGKCCKHVLSVHICYLAGIELDTPPIPFSGEPVVIGGRKTWDGGTRPGDIYEEINF